MKTLPKILISALACAASMTVCVEALTLAESKSLQMEPMVLSCESVVANQCALLAEAGLSKTEIMRVMNQSQMPAFEGRIISRSANDDGTETVAYSCSGYGNTGQHGWMITVNYDAANGKAKVQNLGGFLPSTVSPVDTEATYQDGKLTFPCSTYNTSSTSTKLGNYYGYMAIYLVAGEYNRDERQLNAEESFVLEVSDDLTTLSSNGKAMAGAANQAGRLQVLDYAYDLSFAQMEAGCFTRIDDTELYFEPVLAGSTATCQLTLFATGTENADFQIQIDSEDFVAVPSQGTVAASTSSDVTIKFCALTEGEKEATAKIHFGNDDYEVKLYGWAEAVPTDFSAIVTDGDASFFSWKNPAQGLAWTLNETKAVPGNIGMQAEWDDAEFEQDPDNYEPTLYSSLEASYDAAEAQDFSFAFMAHDDMEGQRLQFAIDGEQVFSFVPQKGKEYTYDYLLPAGHHTLRWTYITTMWADTHDMDIYVTNLSVHPAKDAWKGISPVKHLVPAVANGWQNYNGKAVAAQSGAQMDFAVAADGLSFFSFDYELEAGAQLKVLVDGTEVAAASTDANHFDTDIQTGSHTVSLVATGKAKVYELAAGQGHYTTTTLPAVTLYKAYFDADRGFSVKNGIQGSYSTTVNVLSDGRVVFENLFAESESAWPETYPVVGRFGDDGKIHISNTSRDINLGLVYGRKHNGVLASWDDVYYLLAGGYDDNGTMLSQNEIVISTNADTTCFTVQSAFGLERYYMNSVLGTTTNYLQPGTQILSAGQGIYVGAETLDFGTVYVGSSVDLSFLVANRDQATEYAISIEGKDKAAFKVNPQTGDFMQLEPAMISISLQAEYAGNLEAQLVIITEDDEYQVALKANVYEPIDYSAIATVGGEYITWSSDSQYPWTVTDGVATSSNQGQNNSLSSFQGAFTVPAGYVATFSFVGDCKMEPSGDFFYVSIDGQAEPVYVESIRNDQMYFQYAFTQGSHSVRFDFEKDGSDKYEARGDYASVHDVRLELVALEADCAVRVADKKPFTQLAEVDGVAAAQVALVNFGVNTLGLNSVQGDGYFTAVMTDQVAQTGDTLYVDLLYQPTQAGAHSGTVELNTTAGTFTVELDGEADYVKYIGGATHYYYHTPYCNLYIYYKIAPIYTQSIYPAEWLEGLEGKAIESMTFFSLGMSDYTYSCPDSEWQFGYTENSKVPSGKKYTDDIPTVYRGLQPSVENFELCIPFDEPVVYEGGNYIVQSLMHEIENHNGMALVNFPFVGTMSTEASTGSWCSSMGLQTDPFVPYMRLKYTPESPVSIQQVTDHSAAAAVSTTYYNAEGKQVQKLGQGINVVVVKYADGTAKSTIQYVH